DGRAYPGGERLGPDDANIDVTYGRQARAFGPDEVGAHPASESPYGAHDMTGNVWEIGLLGDDTPLLRGGSSYQNDLTGHLDNREPAEPTVRDPLSGLRICATPSW